ncbi:hypothetical protein DY000_02040065 [Brassica cretica]|uniref:Uncharacterized protein n=1 Tax=Brassica cretica TaxID=69181 RepID=A0ABQ7BHY9_BRACR|nr:hypothetical protein DY000_02040065 [Brassica cretica]
MIWLRYMGASIEEQTRMHGFGLYPLIDARDSSVATFDESTEISARFHRKSRPIILDSPNPDSETPRESERSNTEDTTIDLEDEEEELEEELEIDRQEGTNIDRPTAVNIDRKTESNIDRRSTPAEPAVERVYKTLLPFPPKKIQTKRELDKVI